MTRYFDCNATAPLHPAARQAWLETSERHWHNPSGLYREAGSAKRMLEDIREQVADWLGCDSPEEVVFFSGATEANNAVMQHFGGMFQTEQGRGVKNGGGGSAESGGVAPVTAFISLLEHPSLAESARHEFGAALRVIPCGPDGVTDVSALREMLQSQARNHDPGQPGVVSIMAANNETGVLQPWMEAAQLCRELGVAFHCDAAQWIGKLPSAGLGACGFVTGSAHKFGGPKGVGFLKVPSSSSPLSRPVFRWLRGGPQEERRRAGTENLPAIAAMAAAWDARERDLQAPQSARLEGRALFERELQALLPGAGIVARHSPRLWNTVLVTVPPPVNVKWLTRLSTLGFQVSTGSACSQGGGASEVLRAMGVPESALSQVIRVSAAWETSREDWLALAQAFAEAAATIHDRPARVSPIRF